jgi:hypothetical protein
LGRQVTLDDLDLPATVKPARRERKQVAGAHLSCPNCGGALSLHAPESERVTCPSCNSLLDVNQGELRFLKALEPSEVEPIIPLGTKGKLEDQEYITIGFMERSVTIDDRRYYWEEFLLYHDRAGFRWLVRSDNHWNFVQSLPPGSVDKDGRTAFWEGQSFKLFQKAPAYVEHVLGEFYWRVEVGELVQAADYVKPPLLLSREVTRYEGEDKGEVNWSLGKYISVAEVEKAFGVTGLPRPGFSNVAPNQPFLYTKMYLFWGLFAGLSLLMFVIVCGLNPGKKVFEKTFDVTGGNTAQSAQVVFSEHFDLSGWKNVYVEGQSDVDNGMVFVEGDLINEEKGTTQPFSLELGRWHGTEDGEAWSEGSGEASEYLSSPPAGKYTLRLEFARQFEPGSGGARPTSVRIKVEQGVPRFLPWFLTFLLLSLIPGCVLAYHIYFVKRQWDESQFSMFGTK